MSEPGDPPVPPFGDPVPPTCEGVRRALRAYARGELAAAEQVAMTAHLAGCEACRQAQAADAALDTALGERLPRFAAPLHLRQQLARTWAPPSASYAPPSASEPAAPLASAPLPRATGPRRATPDRRSVVIGLAVAAAFVVSWISFHRGREPLLAENALVTEAVNDHLRVVQSSHPVEIESGGIHQVKPWFTGKVDFAPRVTFSGDDEFPLVGGSVGYFIDRKAAVMVFRHKLHTLTLLILPRAGLPWPAESTPSSRGFHLRFWQRDDLGFVLVSDANAATLDALAGRLERE